MIHKYGYLLIEGETKANALLFKIVTIPQKSIATIVTKSGGEIVDGSGQKQKRLLNWANAKIVEWFEDEGAKNTPQEVAIYAARDAFNAKYPNTPWPKNVPLIFDNGII